MNQARIDPRLSEISNCLYRVSIKAIVINNDKILLVKEQDDEWWSLPGGGMDHGEDISQALCREVSEELGIDVDKISTDGKVISVNTGLLNGIPKINLLYCVSIPTDEIKPTDHVIQSGWFTANEVQGLYLSPSTGNIKQWIKGALSEPTGDKE